MFVALLIIIFTCLLSVSLYLCLSRKQVTTKQGKFVFLRVNNEPIRNTIREAGINLCPCCRSFSNNYLFANLEGSMVCGFNESRHHFIEDAEKYKHEVVDCGDNVLMFITEVLQLNSSCTKK